MDAWNGIELTNSTVDDNLTLISAARIYNEGSHLKNDIDNDNYDIFINHFLKEDREYVKSLKLLPYEENNKFGKDFELMTIFNPIWNSWVRLTLDLNPEFLLASNEFGGKSFMTDFLPLEYVINDEEEKPSGF